MPIFQVAFLILSILDHPPHSNSVRPWSLAGSIGPTTPHLSSRLASRPSRLVLQTIISQVSSVSISSQLPRPSFWGRWVIRGRWDYPRGTMGYAPPSSTQHIEGFWSEDFCSLICPSILAPTQYKLMNWWTLWRHGRFKSPSGVWHLQPPGYPICDFLNQIIKLEWDIKLQVKGCFEFWIMSNVYKLWCPQSPPSVI